MAIAKLGPIAAQMRGGTDGGQPMSTFDNPFDPTRGLNRAGCACGRHVSPIEHERDAQSQLQCAPVESPAAGRSASQSISEEKHYEGVVASAVMRAVFPHD